jgi:iron-sulfur cluster insertion protein
MTQAAFPFLLTDAARARIRDVVAEEDGHDILRVFVQGGGCAGFSYGFSLDEALQQDDLEMVAEGFRVVVDPFSAALIEGATVDWEESVTGSRFVIRNPNAKSTCGCGASFST